MEMEGMMITEEEANGNSSMDVRLPSIGAAHHSSNMEVPTTVVTPVKGNDR